MKTITPTKKPLIGTFTPPADKSIGHRAAILLSLAKGEASISNFPEAADCLTTLSVLQDLGINIEREGKKVYISSHKTIQSPRQALDCQNSGTTARFLLGLLSAVPGLRATLVGDASLQRRPMERVTTPLQKMGAIIHGKTLPVSIEGASLQGIFWEDPKSSAQVKSALLLAGLSANQETRYRSPFQSRDHTERMLASLGCSIVTHGTEVTVQPSTLTAKDIVVPADPSSAAFWSGAAAIIEGSEITAKGVCLNPTRLGFYRVLQQMGATILLSQQSEEAGEPIGTITTKSSSLIGVTLAKEEVPSLIDEIPLLAVLATQAHGETRIEGASELRVKESDRISAICQNLSQMGARIEELPDGLLIRGPTQLKGASLRSFLDHRIAMAMSIAALTATGESTLDDDEVVGISYPGFFRDLESFLL